jgi:hypothetical protein
MDRCRVALPRRARTRTSHSTKHSKPPRFGRGTARQSTLARPMAIGVVDHVFKKAGG